MEENTGSEEIRLAGSFVGVAKVPIETLNFDHSLFKEQHRPTSEKIVDRLQSVFRREGCRRNERANWIDALVDTQRLDSALADNGLTTQDLRIESESRPLLNIGQIDCLNGIHRILAASDLLNRNDSWWTVRLFSKDLPLRTRIKLIEGHLNEQPPSDGEIFRKIRVYHNQGNKEAENKWWARLTITKQKDLKQLLRNPAFAAAFDKLVDMPGLWYPIKLGTLHRLLTLRCDEELFRYLDHVWNAWKKIVDASGVSPTTIDRFTVEKLELLAPSKSFKDRALLEKAMDSREVFKDVTHQPTRDIILSALYELPGLVPTLRTFFENLKYIEPCCNILKKLLPAKERRTLYQSFAASYFEPTQQIIECSEGKTKRISRDDYEHGIWLSYTQLWAFCLRHFPRMTQIMPRKELGKEKPAVRSNIALWHHLGVLAMKLGFHTEQARAFQEQDPHKSLAHELLLSINAGSLPNDPIVLELSAVLDRATCGPEISGKPRLTQTSFLPVERRCGRPFENDFDEERQFLFIPFIYEMIPSCGPDVAPFFVKQDIFTRFLGEHYGMSVLRSGNSSNDDSNDDNNDDNHARRQSISSSIYSEHEVELDEPPTTQGPVSMGDDKGQSSPNSLYDLSPRPSSTSLRMRQQGDEVAVLSRDVEQYLAELKKAEERIKELEQSLQTVREQLDDQLDNQDLEGHFLQRHEEDPTREQVLSFERERNLELQVERLEGQIRELESELNADMMDVTNQDMEKLKEERDELETRSRTLELQCRHLEVQKNDAAKEFREMIKSKNEEIRNAEAISSNLWNDLLELARENREQGKSFFVLFHGILLRIEIPDNGGRERLQKIIDVIKRICENSNAYTKTYCGGRRASGRFDSPHHVHESMKRFGSYLVYIQLRKDHHGVADRMLSQVSNKDVSAILTHLCGQTKNSLSSASIPPFSTQNPSIVSPQINARLQSGADRTIQEPALEMVPSNQGVGISPVQEFPSLIKAFETPQKHRLDMAAYGAAAQQDVLPFLINADTSHHSSNPGPVKPVTHMNVPSEVMERLVTQDSEARDDLNHLSIPQAEGSSKSLVVYKDSERPVRQGQRRDGPISPRSIALMRPQGIKRNSSAKTAKGIPTNENRRKQLQILRYLQPIRVSTNSEHEGALEGLVAQNTSQLRSPVAQQQAVQTQSNLELVRYGQQVQNANLATSREGSLVTRTQSKSPEEEVEEAIEPKSSQSGLLKRKLDRDEYVVGKKVTGQRGPGESTWEQNERHKYRILKMNSARLEDTRNKLPEFHADASQADTRYTQLNLLGYEGVVVTRRNAASQDDDMSPGRGEGRDVSTMPKQSGAQSAEEL